MCTRDAKCWVDGICTLTIAHDCSRFLTICSRFAIVFQQCRCSFWVPDVPLGTSDVPLGTADVLFRTCAHDCSRLLTIAHGCSRLLTIAYAFSLVHGYVRAYIYVCHACITNGSQSAQNFFNMINCNLWQSKGARVSITMNLGLMCCPQKNRHGTSSLVASATVDQHAWVSASSRASTTHK